MKCPARNLATDARGLSAIEFSIAAPVLISLIWGMFQISLLMEANAGVQNSLGQAARYATIYPTPTDTQISSRITSSRFGGGYGSWSTPTITTDAAANTKTITVSYTQPLNFLFFNGPTVTLTKTKIVHLST
jgi:Flp pilus assembly protein TadG